MAWAPAAICRAEQHAAIRASIARPSSSTEGPDGGGDGGGTDVEEVADDEGEESDRLVHTEASMALMSSLGGRIPWPDIAEKKSEKVPKCIKDRNNIK